ncbi:hypothetical protein P170DRAFT_421333 [Aspergillus steynii IBT 23096]|uniref:Uncharacterized protein n=1 Tax=Aspergillus steynii IBT 23096 TaxID=1392250 RepID=A0A2I2GP69_9EURO|nr:uncharacterized protein P170DRAFT_421333 [Aspergillus steynii IBT 23096]PLB54668.1 hypothetical protein P170DRAFT_421333 [Aspergillus steynii IBT 23096]
MEDSRKSAAVVRSPVDKSCHFFFFVERKKQTLALEKRSTHISKGYSPYVNHEIAKGIIEPNSQIAAVLQSDMVGFRSHWLFFANMTPKVSVYGITKPDEKKKNLYLSKLSPTHNILVDSIDKPIIVSDNSMAVASCSDDRELTFVYYTSLTGPGKRLQLNELELWDASNKGISMPIETVPCRNISRLCAVLHRETLVRFVLFAGSVLDGEPHFLFWTCSESKYATHFGKSNVTFSSDLAVASTEGKDQSGPYLNIFLYIANPAELFITRIVGRARRHHITWFGSGQIDFPRDKTSSLAVISDDKRNYLYYNPPGKNTYEAFVDVVEDKWFKP